MMKKNLPVIIVIVMAIAISYLYFNPLLNGKRLNDHDRINALGAQKEAKDYKETTSNITYWTNSMFGGMPTVTFWAQFKGNVIKMVRKIEKAGIYPATFLILLILGSFLCLILFGVNPWLSMVGALLFSFGSHFFILAQAGHITKLWALTYMVPLIGSIYYTFAKNKLIGALLTAIFLSLEISAVHPQITYYALIVVLLFGVVAFVNAIIKKSIADFLVRSAYLILPVILAVGTNANYLLTTQEYTQFSTRGSSILTEQENINIGGLDKDYILDYSYDIPEALTAFIPRLKGGGMSEALTEDSKLFEELSKSQGKQQAGKIIQNIPLYWGSQPIVSGPFYFGAITIFLFVLGLFLVKGYEKWWLLSVVVVSFLLSLGKFFPALSHFAIDYIPLYNKFRDVKNIVFIQGFAMWLLGLLALKGMFQDSTLFEKKSLEGLKYATAITGGFALLFVIAPTLAGSFQGSVDAQLASSGWPAQLLSALREDRMHIARMDAFRSMIFVLLAACLLWLALKKKLRYNYALIIAALLILIDMWPIDKRYLNNDDFVSKRKAEVPFDPSPADQAILQDKSLDYRVLNMSVNPWSDASTSYFHKSIGGYSGAKLRRYQDMIEHHLSPELQQIGARLQSVKSQADIDDVFKGLNALNMLNTKYTIYNPKAAPLINNQAFGNAWFVNGVQMASNADEEIDLVGKVDVKSAAIINQEFQEMLPAQLDADSSANISLKFYAPDKLVYQSSSNADQLAVFSEIYYPKGWVATIDGNEIPILRANYILRAMMIPKGQHEIVFTFQPKSYEIGNKVSFASSVLLLLAIAGVLLFEFKKRKKAANVQ